MGQKSKVKKEPKRSRTNKGRARVDDSTFQKVRKHKTPGSTERTPMQPVMVVPGHGHRRMDWQPWPTKAPDKKTSVVLK